ncbi:RNA polymerase-associated protein CTR9 [Musa troglodytarum]|uniref:RNA polymerase-associated protein CTR9 n=1 Tax=Musa troglodytarum TaxID=320322 RepID=A0A9E7GTJ9_9LILI|nr:RNA polymerase-associated protein CTR9 [Musa troglodytarum]
MGGVVYIPVQNSEEEVMVALDHLPRDATDMIDILKAEQAPLHLWLIIAVGSPSSLAREYFKQGKLDQFRQILEEGSSPEIDEYYADVKYERIAILNALAAYYTYLGKIETKQRDKEEHFISATQYYNRASRIDAHEPYTWIGKGQLYVAKGELQTASESFRIALVEDPNCVPALLGQACVDFNIAEREEHYKKAMDSYRSSLEFYKLTETALAVSSHGLMKAHSYYNLARSYHSKAVGHIYSQLGEIDKAVETFRKATRIDPKDSVAFTELGDLLISSDAGAALDVFKTITDALKVDDKCPNALSMLGDLELKIDDWVKAKDTFRAAKDATDGKDSYATLALGNWNYFAAIRNEKRGPKLEATHLEKAKELYTKVLMQHPSNLYAANGAAIVLAEKGHFDVSKDIFTQVQEAASGSVFVQMPDVWVNLAHVYFAQGHFALAAKMVRSTVTELKNAVCIFSQLSAASIYHSHGFDEKKLETHVEYCKHLLDAAKVHCEAAEREEQQNRQRLEVARQEQWKHSSNTAGKRRERSQVEDEEGGDRRRRRGGKRRKKEKKMKTRYEEEADMEDEHEDLEEDTNAMNEYEDDGAEKAQNDLIAAGLEDSDAEDDLGGHSTAINRKRRAWSESDEDDEPLGEKVNSAETDEETNGIKAKSVAGDDDEGDD